MRLAIKLGGLPLLLSALVGVSAIIQVYSSAADRRAFQASTLVIQQAGGTLNRLTVLFSSRERDLFSYYLQPDGVTLRRLHQATADVGVGLDALARQNWPRTAEHLVQDLREAEHLLAAGQEQLTELGGEDRKRTESTFVTWRLVSQRADAMLADLSMYNVKRLDRTLAQAERTRRVRNGFAIVITVLAAACAALFAASVMRGVLRPLVALTQASKRIGEDPGATAPRMPNRHDEIGMLSEALAAMTERLTAVNAELAKALTAREEFMSVAAHELKTPITSLKLQFELVKRAANGLGGSEKLTKSVGAVERQLARVSQLVDELLDVARLQAGRLQLHLEDVAVPELVREVVGRFSYADGNGLGSVTLALEEGVTARADASRLDQVLVNLLGNAGKYAPKAPVHISVARGADQAIVRVRDEGPGIPPELQPRLFQPYVRAREARGQGLGLGLHICKQILEAQGGSIQVASAPGEGAEFTLRIPLAPRP